MPYYCLVQLGGSDFIEGEARRELPQGQGPWAVRQASGKGHCSRLLLRGLTSKKPPKTIKKPPRIKHRHARRSDHQAPSRIHTRIYAHDIYAPILLCIHHRHPNAPLRYGPQDRVRFGLLFGHPGRGATAGAPLAFDVHGRRGRGQRVIGRGLGGGA